MLTVMYGLPESIACYDCDAGSPEDLGSAIVKGWTQLKHNDGTGWNYLGLCPACKVAVEAEEREADLESLGRMRSLLEEGWRPVRIHNSCDDYAWVDPEGGLLMSHDDALQAQGYRNDYGVGNPKREELVEALRARNRGRFVVKEKVDKVTG